MPGLGVLSVIACLFLVTSEGIETNKSHLDNIPPCLVYKHEEKPHANLQEDWNYFLNPNWTRSKPLIATLFLDIFLYGSEFTQIDACSMDFKTILPFISQFANGTVDIWFRPMLNISQIVFLPLNDSVYLSLPDVFLIALARMQDVELFQFQKWLKIFKPVFVHFDLSLKDQVSEDRYKEMIKKIDKGEPKGLKRDPIEGVQTYENWRNLSCHNETDKKDSNLLFGMTCNETAPVMDNVLSLWVTNIGKDVWRKYSAVNQFHWPSLRLFTCTKVTVTKSMMEKSISLMPHLQIIMLHYVTFLDNLPTWDEEFGRNITVLEYNGIQMKYLKSHHFPRHASSVSFSRCNISSISQNTFAGKSALKSLRLDHNKISSLQNVSFIGAPLMTLNLYYNLIKTLHQNVKWPPTLRNLYLGHNQIESVHVDDLNGAGELEFLDLRFNRIKVFTSFDIRKFASFNTLDLSSNGLEKINLKYFAEGIFPLMNLNLSHNRLYKMNFSSVPRVLQGKESNIDASYNSLQYIPDRLLSFSMKTNLDLSHNNITFKTWMHILEGKWFYKLRIYDFKIRINMKHNKIQSMKYNFSSSEKSRLEELLYKLEWDLSNNPLECDCYAYDIYVLLRNISKNISPNRFVTWVCSKPEQLVGKQLISLSDTDFMCYIPDAKDCPSMCKCFHLSVNDQIYVNCSSLGLIDAPDILPALTHSIILSNNSLKTMSQLDKYLTYPFLQEIDLSNNEIRIIDKAAVLARNSLTTLHLEFNKLSTLPKLFQHMNITNLYLGNNIFNCDCKNIWLYHWLSSSFDAVRDLDNVICSTGKQKGEMMMKASEYDMTCEMSLPTKISIGVGILAFLIPVLMVVLYCFRGEIRLYLYTRFNWHPFERADDQDAQDKLYDVFVSYSGLDDAWVIEEFLVRMESPESPYHVCLSARDFLPTVSVSENVCNSVKYSRRMVMLLTRNFLTSEWCSLEFKAAHHRVLRDKINYLIILLADDVNIRDLDEDLKLYLRTNTYIEWNSRWFWERLFYALPKIPLVKLRGQVMPEGGFPPLFPRFESLYEVLYYMLLNQSNTGHDHIPLI